MSRVLSYNAPQYNLTTKISSGQTQSAAISLATAKVDGTATSGYVPTLVGLFLPASFEGTSITFQVASTAAGTYVNLIDGAGNTITKTVAASTYLYLDPNIFAGIEFMKITISVGGAVGADRTITLATRCIT